MGGAVCITHAVPVSPHAPARFGYIVSKAVGNAVTRNLVRRRMKFVTERLIHEGVTGTDYVFRALPGAATAPFAQLEHEMRRGIAKAASARGRAS